MRKIIFLTLLLVVTIAFVSDVFADESVASQMKLKWGHTWRLRHEYWKNWKDMENNVLDNRNFFRFKTSLWGQADLDENISLFVKLTNEFKPYAYFYGSSGDKSDTKKGYHFDINEIVFDNLYADIKNFLDLPVDLRVGRQDFLGTYGEGFLIMDGTPQDGSRTFYFNALKASWKVDDENTLDFIYMNNPRDEEYLPVINRLKLASATTPTLDKAPQALNTTDEEGLVLYLKNKSIKDLSLEPFYIYKMEEEEGGGTSFQSEKGRINTIGAFAKYEFSPFTLRGQIAGQFGDYGNNDRKASGGYVYLDKSFKDVAWSPKATIGYACLSGDDLGTSDNEAWDPLFSRWPWISELYVLTMAAETKILGYWTNLQAYNFSVSLRPSEKTKLSFWYYFLRANESTSPSPSTSLSLSGKGKDRGHLPQIRFDYAFNKNITSYILAEYFIPKSFYSDSADEALFFRFETQLKF